MSSIDPNSHDAVLIRASEAEVTRDAPNSVIELLADSDLTNGLSTTTRSKMGAGTAGAPPHYHTHASEMFFIVGGSLQIMAGDEVTTLNEGDFFIVPPHMPHAFAPAPGSHADVFVVFTPGVGRFDYYRLLDRVNRGEADAQEIPASSERFDNHYVDSPLWRATRASV